MNKDNKMATQINMGDIKFFQSPNFWTAVVLAIGGLFIGFPEGSARDLVAGLFALVASGGGLYQFFKTAKTDVKAWLNSANTWNYIAAASVAIFPTLPVDVFEKIHQVLTSAIGGNWQGIVTAMFSLATILYKVFKK